MSEKILTLYRMPAKAFNAPHPWASGNPKGKKKVKVKPHYWYKDKKR